MSSNNTDTFPYGEYPNNIAKLTQIAEKNQDNKEKKLLLCMSWCKDRIPQFDGQVIMDLCIASYNMKGKFLQEMDQEEIRQTMDELMGEYELD
jgi:hypothetical protein